MIKPWILIIDNEEVLGVSWYAEYFYSPRASWELDPEPHYPGELMIRPLDPVTRLRAEWWRRAGFWLLRRFWR